MSLPFFLVVAVLVCVRWYLTAVLICNSPMTNDAEYLSMNLASSYVFFGENIFSLVKSLFKHFAHFN